VAGDQGPFHAGSTAGGANRKQGSNTIYPDNSTLLKSAQRRAYLHAMKQDFGTDGARLSRHFSSATIFSSGLARSNGSSGVSVPGSFASGSANSR
jgi:hypothetical protein